MSTPHDEIVAAAEDIANQLGENHPPARLQIRRVVEQVGVEVAYDFLRQTLEVEAQGGMQTNDKQRRRTPGGTFFYNCAGEGVAGGSVDSLALEPEEDAPGRWRRALAG